MFLQKEMMASNDATRTFDSEVNADSLQTVLSDKSDCSNVEYDIDERKWKFRPPPRGLTPTEYVLCHR